MGLVQTKLYGGYSIVIKVVNIWVLFFLLVIKAGYKKMIDTKFLL